MRQVADLIPSCVLSCEPVRPRTDLLALYFACEPSACGIGESYIFTVLPGTVSAVCAAGVGSGVSPCVYICVYVYIVPQA